MRHSEDDVNSSPKEVQIQLWWKKKAEGAHACWHNHHNWSIKWQLLQCCALHMVILQLLVFC